MYPDNTEYPGLNDMSEPQNRDVENGASSDGHESAEPGLERQDGEATEEQSGVAEQELLAMRDALLRTRAEMDNLRKRSERELDKARRFINEGLMKDLVPVLDTLDQALESTPEEAESQRQGLVLLKKQLLHSLERHGLGVVDPLGEPFNPDWHEAMSLQPSTDHEPDTVMLVLQRGYTLNGRLLRPARVIVAR
jgi:molecular chaperone GrpE